MIDVVRPGDTDGQGTPDCKPCSCVSAAQRRMPADGLATDGIMRADAVALLLPLLCGACTGHGSEAHRAELADFIGISEAELGRRLGQADEVSGNITQKFVVYRNIDARYVNPTAGYRYDHDYNAGFGRPPAIAEFNCRVTFAVENGLVRAYDLAGNGCR